MTFLPEGYNMPKSEAGSYITLGKSDVVKFRVVSSAVIGYSYWNVDGKKISMREKPSNTPADIGCDKSGKQNAVKHFWAFKVLDREDGAIKIIEIDKRTVMEQILTAVNNEEWGSPTKYDLTISKAGSGMETKYSVLNSPQTALSSEEIDLVANDDKKLEELTFDDSEHPIQGKTGAQEAFTPVEEDIPTIQVDDQDIDDVKIDTVQL